jgi:hypothetical protein
MSRLDLVGKRTLAVVKRYSIPYTITRYNPGSYDSNGRWNADTTTAVPIQAHIQPLTGKEKDEVPEGRREKDMIRIYSDTVLKGVEVDSTKTQPDRITYDNRTFEVFNARVWLDTWYRAIGIRVN